MTARWQAALLALLWLLLPSSALAQSDVETMVEEAVTEEATPEGAAQTAAVTSTWLPPEVATDNLDWLRMSSGEWIRGNIEYMRDGKMDFDSEDLDLLSIDWDDIVGLYSPSVNRFVLEDDVIEGTDVLEGPAVLEDGTLTVTTDAGPVMVSHGAVLAILEGEATERNRWSFKITLGIDATFFNSEQAGTSTSARIVREDPNTRLGLDYHGALGFSRGERTINNHWGGLTLDWFITREFFLTLAQGNIGHDEFRNLDIQANAGAGLGYTIVDTAAVDWDVSLVGAYVYTRFGSVPAGGNLTESGAAVIPATRLDVETDFDFDFGFNHTSVLVVTNFDLSYYKTSGYVSWELTDILDFDISSIWDRVRQPVPTADGQIPNKNTVQLIVGFGLDF